MLTSTIWSVVHNIDGALWGGGAAYAAEVSARIAIGDLQSTSHCAATVQQVVRSVKRVTDVISGTSVASGEQRTGIEQGYEAVSLMDKVAQQNFAMVEEAAAAADSLREQTGSPLPFSLLKQPKAYPLVFFSEPQEQTSRNGSDEIQSSS